MLTPEEWSKVSKQAGKIYEKLEDEIIKEIAERIAATGIANSVVENDIKIAQQMGILYDDIIALVAKYNNTTPAEVKQVFMDASIKSLNYDDKIYRLVGKSPIPLIQTPYFLDIIEGTLRKTNFDLNKLTMSTALTSQTQFYNAINTAYLEASSGVKSYSAAILDAIKSVSKEGALVEYPSGRRLSIESAVRMNVLTGINQTCGVMQKQRAEEMEWDLMELSAHIGARVTDKNDYTNHSWWQGRIVSLSGKKGYLSLDDIGYGDVAGFKGANCRHDWRPYLEGSKRLYTDEELENMKNATVTYNGQQISYYEATQMQRKMERNIRQDKKEISAFESILTSNIKDDKLIEDTKTELLNKKIQLKQHNAILNDFVRQTKLNKDNSRLFVNRNQLEKTEIKNSNDTWVDFKTMDEAKNYVYDNYKDSDIDKMKNLDSVNTVFRTLDNLKKQYPLVNNIFVRNATLRKAKANGSCDGITIHTPTFNKADSKAMVGNDWQQYCDNEIKNCEQYLGNAKYKQRPIERAIEEYKYKKNFNRFSVSDSYNDQDSLKATICHEYGHVIADQYFGQINKMRANPNFNYYLDNDCYKKCRMVSQVYREAIRTKDIFKLSHYASTDDKEFFAECFAIKQMGEKLPDYIDKMINEVLKNG